MLIYANTQFRMGFIDAVKLILLQFSIFTPSIINIAPRTNNFEDSFQLVCSGTGKRQYILLSKA